jgi:hypothetical protein
MAPGKTFSGEGEARNGGAARETLPFRVWRAADPINGRILPFSGAVILWVSHSLSEKRGRLDTFTTGQGQISIE